MPDRITIDIEDRSGNKQGPGPIATALSLTYSDALNRAGTFEFVMPARDDRADDLDQKIRLVRIYDNGAQVFLGIVENMTREVDDGGVGWLRVAGRNMLGELAEISVGELEIESSGTAATTAPTDIMALASSWSVDSSPPSPYVGTVSTAKGVYARFAHESVLQALVRVHEVTGENFLQSDEDRKIIWIRDQWADSGVRLVQGGADPVGLAANANVGVIQALEQVEEAHELINRVYPFGSGEGAARLTIEPGTYNGTSGDFNITRASNYIDYAPAGYAYGTPTIERAIQFPEITPISNTDTDLESAADMLAEAAFRYLEWYGNPQTFYSVEAVGLPSSVRPGMTVRVVYEDDALSVDADLNVIEVERRIGADGQRSARLLVSDTDRWPRSDEEEIVGQMVQGYVARAHQQMGPATWTVSYREKLDDTTGADLYFWLGEEIAQVQQVMLRFRVDELESTVTGNASESSHTHDVAMDDHQHKVYAAHYGGGNRNVEIDGTGFFTYAGTDIGNIGVPTTEVTGTITETSASGSSHTHGMTYGVFKETSANTYGHTGGASSLAQIKTDLNIEVGGLDRGSNAAGAGATGWYELDATQWLADTTTGRPNNEANVISFTRKTATMGKTAMVVAQLQIRAIIQSVAYS